MRFIFWFILLFPSFAFACGETNKPTLVVSKIERLFGETSIELIIPFQLGERAIYDATVRVGKENSFVTSVPLELKEITNRFPEPYIDYLGDSFGRFIIGEKFESKLELEVSYRDVPKDNFLGSCPSRFMYSFEELVEAHNQTQKKNTDENSVSREALLKKDSQ